MKSYLSLTEDCSTGLSSDYIGVFKRVEAVATRLKTPLMRLVIANFSSKDDLGRSIG